MIDNSGLIFCVTIILFHYTVLSALAWYHSNLGRESILAGG